MPFSKYKHDLFQALWEFWEVDMRWSYLAIPVLVVAGAVANHYLAGSWSIWPVVFVVAVMLVMHESVVREGVGVAPLHAYAFFAGALFLCLALLVVLSKLGGRFLLFSIVPVLLYAARGYWVNRRHERLIQQRRKEGRCVHCGFPVTPDMQFCPNCLEEPDPYSTTRRRIAAHAKDAAKSEHARELLGPQDPNAPARKKEKTLIARHHHEESKTQVQSEEPQPPTRTNLEDL